MKVYLVWEEHSMEYPILLTVFSSRKKAKLRIEELEHSRSSSYDPKFDDYGLIEGINYFVEERLVE